MFSINSMVYAWDNCFRYALALIDDLTEEQMLLRPGGNMNHPAWILGHLSLYYPIIPQLLKGEIVTDPADDQRFGFRGQGPVQDSTVYGSKESQVERLVSGHEQVAQALLAATSEDLQRSPSLARWAKTYPTVEFMLPDLMLCHEGIHIGQLSIWRRAAGLPSVTFPDRTPRKGLI